MRNDSIDLTDQLPEVAQRNLRGEIRALQFVAGIVAAGIVAGLVSLVNVGNWHSDQEVVGALMAVVVRSDRAGQIMLPAEALKIRKKAERKFRAAHPEWSGFAK